MPNLANKYSRTKMISRLCSGSRGEDSRAARTHKKVAVRSDNEPSILELKDAVRKESDVEAVLEEAPAGDHQAKWLVENALKNVQGPFGVIKDALESRRGREKKVNTKFLGGW